MQPLTEQELAVELQHAEQRRREARSEALDLRNARWTMLDNRLHEELETIEMQAEAELAGRDPEAEPAVETDLMKNRPCQRQYVSALQQARPILIEAIAEAQAQIAQATSRHRQRLQKLDELLKRRFPGTRLAYADYTASRQESAALLEAEIEAITEAFQPSWQAYVEATGSHRAAALNESRLLNEAIREAEEQPSLSENQTAVILRKKEDAIRAARERHQRARDHQHHLLIATNETTDARFEAEVAELNSRKSAT
jgi:hypothetical protein